MLLDRLADVLTFEQVEGDRFVADPFGDKTATRAEVASDDRLDYLETWEGPPFFQGCYALALVLVIAGQTVSEELVPLSTHSAFARAGAASLTDQRYLATGTIHTESGVLASTIAQAGIFLAGPSF